MDELSFDDVPRRRGRGAASNPPTQFEPMQVAYDPAALDEEELRSVPTEVFEDSSRTVLARNDSPDVGFDYSLNPYRGCEHGCIYCYARPSHEYLGFSAGLDFETKIVVKKDAPELLAKEFRKPSWTPQVIALAGNTDPYQPLERTLKLTRRCLQVMAAYRNPVSIITKNYTVARDVDVLGEMAARNLVSVNVSITTLRNDLVQVMEPRTARPARRLRAIEKLAEAGVPVRVLVAPVIPGLTDEELPGILKAAADAGAQHAGYVLLRLPGPVKDLFVQWLKDEIPDRADRVLNRLEELRGPSLNDPRFGHRMRGEGQWAELLKKMFTMAARKHGLDAPPAPLSTEHFRRTPEQARLF